MRAPLILSLRLEPEADEFFNRLREQYFPAALNVIPAHVTLFHHLPGEHVDGIVDMLKKVAGEQQYMLVAVTGLRNLGRGVAYTLQSVALNHLRAQLADAWEEWLTPQDRQKFQPHITVQNKVAPETARETLAVLQMSAKPAAVTATGLSLWDYQNGPWEHRATFELSGDLEAPGER